jgi:lantibiotic modifying enzyme
LHAPMLYRNAEEAIKWIPDVLARDDLFDIIGGAAGCIGALLSLYAVAPSASTLATAIQCAEHLIASARTMNRGIGWPSKFGKEKTPLTGMAHGCAGIAMSLLRLFGVSGEERFRETALAAMEYERGMFVTERQNWPDLRDLLQPPTTGDVKATEEPQQKFMVAWCHGAAGIGLARMASLDYADDAAIRAEIDAALYTTLAEGFGTNHSLCHGDTGNLEVVMIAAQTLNNPHYNEQVMQLAAMLLDSIDRLGYRCGIPLGVETPGLMTGLAGTGYALLRFAEPERVPSVLTLAEPRRYFA